MSDDARLTRIEAKLDQMGEAIVALARVEERLVTLFSRLDVIDKDRVAQGARLLVVENNSGSNGQSLRFAERVFWIVVAAAVTYVFKGNLL
jgi:hypothetical protein|tara:strand:+ start:907 stop:1179 length:273 start_codon:yes stop_codon:yes gene_type:complete